MKPFNLSLALALGRAVCRDGALAARLELSEDGGITGRVGNRQVYWLVSGFLLSGTIHPLDLVGLPDDGVPVDQSRPEAVGPAVVKCTRIGGCLLRIGMEHCCCLTGDCDNWNTSNSPEEAELTRLRARVRELESALREASDAVAHLNDRFDYVWDSENRRYDRALAVRIDAKARALLGGGR